jgi:hypothetical protein
MGRSPGKSAAFAAEMLTPKAHSEIAAMRKIDWDIFTVNLAFRDETYKTVV